MVKILLRCGVSLRRRGDTLSRKERKPPPKGVSAYAASRSALCGRRKDRTFVRSVDDARVLRRKRPSRLRPEGHVHSPLGERYLPAEGERLRGKFRFGAFSPQRHQERPRRPLGISLLQNTFSVSTRPPFLPRFQVMDLYVIIWSIFLGPL